MKRFIYLFLLITLNSCKKDKSEGTSRISIILSGQNDDQSHYITLKSGGNTIFEGGTIGAGDKTYFVGDVKNGSQIEGTYHVIGAGTVTITVKDDNVIKYTKSHTTDSNGLQVTITPFKAD
jgi:hypothetical protein